MPVEMPRGKGQKRKTSDSNTHPQKSANKPGAAGLAAAACQVEGCLVDLSEAREYHKRYRICEEHAVMRRVLVDGTLSRFCQQCGRFEDLAIFDSNKRSCRFSLQRHNLRRRRGTKAVAPTVSVLDSIPPSAAETGDRRNNNLHSPAAQRTSERLGTRKRHSVIAALQKPATRIGPFVGRYEEGFEPRSPHAPPPLPMGSDGELLELEVLEDVSDFCPNMSMREEGSFHLLRNANPQVSIPINHSPQFQQQLFQAGEPNPNMSPPGTWAGRNSYTQSGYTGQSTSTVTNSPPYQSLFQKAELSADSSPPHNWAGPSLLPPSPYARFADLPSPTQWAVEALLSDKPVLPRTVSPPHAYQSNSQDGTQETFADCWGLQSHLTPSPKNGGDFHPAAISHNIPSTSSPWPQHTLGGDMSSTVQMEAHILDATTSWGQHLSPQMQQRAARSALLRAQLDSCGGMPVQIHNSTNPSLQAPSSPLPSIFSGMQSIVATPTMTPGATFANPSPTFGASALLSNTAVVGNVGHVGVGSPFTERPPSALSTYPAVVPLLQWQGPDPTQYQTAEPLLHAAAPSLHWQGPDPTPYQTAEPPLHADVPSDDQGFNMEDCFHERADDDEEDVMAGFEEWTLRAASYNQPRERPVDIAMLMRSLSDPSAYARSNARRG